MPVAIVPEKVLAHDASEITKYAQAVEAMGYWGITCKDHVVLGDVPDGNNGYTNEHSFIEPLTLFSFLAGQTETIRMIAGVLVLPQRPTALVAKTAQMVGDFSGGRLILGVGVGSNKTEFAAMGAEMTGRGSKIEDQIIAMRGLWTQPYSDYIVGKEVGRRVGISPRPRHNIPVWIGGWANPVLDRTVRLAEGWAPMGHAGDAAAPMAQVCRLMEKYNRDPATLDVMGAFATQRRGTQVPDTLDQRARDLEQWTELGATSVAYGRQDPNIPPGEALDRHLDDLWGHRQLFKQVTGY